MKQKQRMPAPAADLYTSPLFRGRRAYVERTCDQWFVLSAKHGLVPTAEIVEPYDESLTDATARARRTWSARVLGQVDQLGLDYPSTTFELHAGASYRNFGLLDGLESRGARAEVVAEHLGQGEQLAFYGAGVNVRGGSRPTIRPAAPRAGSYEGLAVLLSNTRDGVVSFSFDRVEAVLGRPLPPSARKHRPWWANDAAGTHSHARAWMSVGWRVDRVDLSRERVEFRRVGRGPGQ